MSGRTLVPAPLTAEAFAPFGDVLETPADTGRRAYFDGALANLRPEAALSLSIVRAGAAPLPPVLTLMERHAFSSQSFLPLEGARWLVVVAPHAPSGGPDMDRALAFLPGPGQGITLGADVWHAPLTILTGTPAFAIVMWKDGGPRDEEFFTIDPLPCEIPGCA